jgi:hypothetical protein
MRGRSKFPNENHLSRFARLLAAVKKRRFARYNIGHVEIARLQAGNGGAAIRNFGEQKREGTAASGGPISKLEVNQPGGVQLIDCGDFLFAVAITEAAKSDLRRGLSMRLDQTNIANLRYRPARQAVPHAHLESIWQRILAKITARRPLIRSWLDTAQPILLTEGVLRVRFGPDQSTAVESLARPNNQRILDELVSEIVGTETRVELEAESFPLDEPPT